MKKLLFILLALLLLAGACVITRPDKEKHSEAIVEAIVDAMNKKTELKADKEAIISALNNAISPLIKVENYHIFSIGKMKYSGKNKDITFGILGNVFLLNKEALNGK